MAKYEVWSKEKDSTMKLIKSEDTVDPIKEDPITLSALIILLKKKGVI